MFPRIATTLALCLALAVSAQARPRVKKLLKQLDAAQGEEQIPTIRALGRSGKKEAVKPLIWIFNIRKESPRHTAAIVEALGRLGDPRGIDPLLGGWDHLNSIRRGLELGARRQALRAQLAEALGLIGGEEARRVLFRALEDDDSRVVRKAVVGLGRLKDRGSVDRLIQILKRRDDTAQSAYEALGEIGDEKALAPLTKSLEDDDVDIRVQAAYGLARMGDKDGLYFLEDVLKEAQPGKRGTILAAYYLAKLDRRDGVDYLVELLDDGNWDLRLRAAEALGKCDNKHAAAPLAEALESEDKNLRLMAVRALGQLGGRRAIAALKRVRKDKNPAVRVAARSALRELGELD